MQRLLKALLCLFKSKPESGEVRRRRPAHYIRTEVRGHLKNKYWLVGTFALALTLQVNAAFLNWGVSNVRDSGGVLSNVGQAWLIAGADTAPTVTAILNNTFNPAGAKAIAGGAASGKYSTPPNVDVSNYLVILESSRYYISAVAINRANQTRTFAFTGTETWVSVPEPGSVLLLLVGGAALLLSRP